MKRLKREILKCLPSMQPHFDYVDASGNPGHGSSAVSDRDWIQLVNLLSKRYTLAVGVVVDVPAGSANRAAFIAAHSSRPREEAMSRNVMVPPKVHDRKRDLGESTRGQQREKRLFS